MTDREPLDLDAIEGRHTDTGPSEDGMCFTACAGCNDMSFEPWPCAAIQLVAEVRDLRGEVERLGDQITIARDELVCKRGDIDEISPGAAVDVLVNQIPEGDSFWVSRANCGDIHYAVEVRRMFGLTPAEEITRQREALRRISIHPDAASAVQNIARAALEGKA